MNYNKRIRFAVMTVILLPSSCMSGGMASGMYEQRISSEDGFLPGPIWLENLLWLTALAVMLLWAWWGNRILKNEK